MSAARASSKKKRPGARKAGTKRPSTRKAATKTRKAKAAAQRVESALAPAQANESELLLAWFRLLARCRGAWLQQLWTKDASLDGGDTITHAELAGILADHDSPNAEAAWFKEQELIGSWQTAANQINEALLALPESRFSRLARVFGLTVEELDLIKLCAAIAFDPALARVCAYLQDHSGRNFMTEELAARMLGLGRAGIWASDMNLFRWELVERRETGAAEPQALVCDPQISEWLQGRSTLDSSLITGAAVGAPPAEVLPEWKVDEIAGWIQEALRQSPPPKLRIVVVAPQGGGKRSFATAVAQQVGLTLLLVNADTADDASWRRLFLRAQRQAFLDGAVPAWIGDTSARLFGSRGHALFPIQFALCEPGAEPSQVAGVIDRRVVLPLPTSETRERLWRQSSPAAKKWKADEVRKLAEHHSVWPGDIERAAQLAPAGPREAAVFVREAARTRFGNLAQIVECPFTVDDLVLPEGVKQLLEAITFEAEERVRFWQEPEPRRLFPLGQGLISLFSGPSGTGKTMAAQVIAARLTQDLCRVNVAQLVSKWVGETAKNAERVIRVAAENNVVLFFDEADAFFAKRATEMRDAQDKFANTDTAFLLQAIESYPGVAILATNLKANIDSAFLRRLRYVVEFPKPDASLQLTLWTKLVSALAGEERAKELTPTIQLLSNSADVTGAQIKLAVLAGIFAAKSENKPLAERHLLIGLDRELGKEGRSIGPRDREKIMKAVAAR